MALVKTPVNINFGQGLDTKSDPNQIPVGKFLALNNMVFTTTGRLTKRNGFTNITTLPVTVNTQLTTLNGNMVTTGADLYAYDEPNNTWLDRGTIQPVQLAVQPVVRTSYSQSSPDLAISPSGLACVAYQDSSGGAYYTVYDQASGQHIINSTLLDLTAANPRVVINGNYFLIFYSYFSGLSTPSLGCRAVPISNPTAISSFIPITAQMAYLLAAYDVVVNEGYVYISWNSSAGAVESIVGTQELVFSAPTPIVGAQATLLALSVDTSTQNIWLSYWNAGTLTATAYGPQLDFVALSPTVVSSSMPNLVTLSSISINSVNTIFDEITATYGTAQTNSIQTATISNTAVITPPSIVVLSLGLASKPFIGPNGKIYMLAAYGQTTPPQSNQPSYFLIDSSGNVYMRLAYSNGAGYSSSQVLPTVSLFNGDYVLPYGFRDFLAAVNKGTNNPPGTPSNAIYTQTGINVASFTINNSAQYSSEIAGALHLTGGQLWEYDGVKPVEHNFQVYPENVTATWSSALTTTGTFIASSYSITVASVSDVLVGMPIVDTTNTLAIPPNTYVTAITGLMLTISNPTNLAGAGHSLSIGGGMLAQPSGYVASLPSYYYQFTYEWTDGAGNLHRSAPSIPISVTTSGTGTGFVTLTVPYLRITYKTGMNPVRIVGYRWSVAQQVYYQFTSIIAPVINNTMQDFVTLTDWLSDAQILGNTLLYTTGGVVEDIAAPASIASTLFKNRLVLVDAEDRNLLWYSKQVIENVPVEMSDLFTLYVAPTSGAQGSTGPITAISAMDDKLIVFKKDAIYYITGTGPDNTGAQNDFSDPIFITSAVGCPNPSSIVLMPNGLMFQSDKGIWLLGRDLNTTYVGAPIEVYNSQTVMSATAIPGTNQVRFILGNNITLVYDYFFGQWGTFNNIRALSATLYDGYHTYLNIYGQIFQENPNSYMDGATPVLVSFTTGWLNVAGLSGYERFYYMLMLGTYYTPFTLDVQIAYDYNSSAAQSVTVSPDNYNAPYGTDPVYGASTPYAGPGNVFQARVFPQIQKCQTFQLTINEVYDPSYGVVAGQGLSLSGMTMIIGVKKGYSPQKASRSFG